MKKTFVNSIFLPSDNWGIEEDKLLISGRIEHGRGATAILTSAGMDYFYEKQEAMKRQTQIRTHNEWASLLDKKIYAVLDGDIEALPRLSSKGICELATHYRFFPKYGDKPRWQHMEELLEWCMYRCCVPGLLKEIFASLCQLKNEDEYRSRIYLALEKINEVLAEKDLFVDTDENLTFSISHSDDLKYKEIFQVKAEGKAYKENDINLTHEFIAACAKIADNPVSYSSFDEDGLNREVRNFMDSAISRFGFDIADQTQQGLSSKKPGELDIRISKNGIPVAIYEGLIHSTQKYLISHIEKAIGTYNKSGCKAVYVVEFSRNKGFGKFWIGAADALKKVKEISVNEESTELNGVKMLKGIFDWEGQQGNLYYIGVNCYCGQPTKLSGRA